MSSFTESRISLCPKQFKKHIHKQIALFYLTVLCTTKLKDSRKDSFQGTILLREFYGERTARRYQDFVSLSQTLDL